MQEFTIEVYDIKNIAKPVKIDEFRLLAEDKAEASDKAHDMSFKKFPSIQRMIKTQR